MTLEDAILRSAEDLDRALKGHRALLDEAQRASQEGTSPARCFLVHCPRERTLREAIVEAIVVLESTRNAFKSKQLETLRKKLIAVVADVT